ncbi:MAG: hypothetical protein ACFFD2_25025 [Promethearchaeota archaeon]
MLKNQKNLKERIHTGRYSNGQLAVFVHDISGEPVAELSIMKDSIDLAPNEFILKDYSENRDLMREYLEAEIFTSSNRFILVSSHLCPICQIAF